MRRIRAKRKKNNMDKGKSLQLRWLAKGKVNKDMRKKREKKKENMDKGTSLQLRWIAKGKVNKNKKI